MNWEESRSENDETSGYGECMHSPPSFLPSFLGFWFYFLFFAKIKAKWHVMRNMVSCKLDMQDFPFHLHERIRFKSRQTELQYSKQWHSVTFCFVSFIYFCFCSASIDSKRTARKLTAFDSSFLESSSLSGNSVLFMAKTLELIKPEQTITL